jgi:ABC-type lipoprotein export system ATPase subunit
MGMEELYALKGITMLSKNEYVAIMGPPGSGKSTLITHTFDTPNRSL